MSRRELGITFVIIALAMTLASCSPSGGPDSTAPLDGRGGGIIVFHSARDGDFEIYVINADGSGQRRLTDDPAEESAPSLSPAGSTIVFSGTFPVGRSDVPQGPRAVTRSDCLAW